MMSIFLAEELERYTDGMPDAVSLEFFCDNKNDKRNTADSIIQGLLFQLLQKRPRLINHILPTFAIQQASLFSASSFESLWRIFENMTCDPMLRIIYCVLDGLDECDEASLKVLLRHFKALFSNNTSGTGSSHLNLIAVSRDRPGIIPKLLSGFPRIRLDGDADIEVNQDITRFIDAKLNDFFPSVEEHPQSTRVRVKNIFRERAQGTFLWIGIAAKTLEGYSAIEYEEALERLPPGLSELYTRMLLGIKVDHRQIAARILRWVVMAVRPLTLSELSAIIEPTREPPTGFTRELLTKNQVSYCGYFLTIKGCEVNLIHQSAKDYLLSEDHDSNPELKGFHMEEKAGNQEIARKCFQYLEDNLLPSGDMDPTRETSYLEAFPLLSYATRYWHVHARTLPCSDDIFDLSRPFYHKNSRIRELWLKTYRDLVEGWYQMFHSFTDSSKLLHMASHFDILPLAEKLLKGFINKAMCFHTINLRDSKGKTALHWAAQGGHPAIARLLLKKGANVNAKNKDGTTALHNAALFGHERVVRLLLDMGADINAKSNAGTTALHLAARYGHEGVVRLLLEKGADIDAKDQDNETALHIAAQTGHEGVVRLLLEMGADVNAKNEDDMTALHRAAISGNRELVRLLLEMGADINAKNRHDRTALHLAAQSGYEVAFRVLLAMAADINAKEKYGRTALHTSTDWNPHEGVIRLLLERGSDINAKDKSGTTVLHMAALSGHERVVRLLLDMGADINATDNAGTTALEYASEEGFEEVVQLLRRMGGLGNYAAPSSEWDSFTAESASVASMRAQFSRCESH